MPKANPGAMHVAKIVTRRNGKEYAAYLLRHSFREDGKVKNRTLANLSALPLEAIEAIRVVLAGGHLLPAAAALGLRLQSSRPHGHVAAALGTARKLGLEAVIEPRPCRQRDLVLAMVVARVLQPASKLATTRLWSTTSLGELLGVKGASADELYAALDWLLERQGEIEKRLAKRYLGPGEIALYDLSSTYVEGEHCPLARRGYSRDSRPDKAQVEFGLLSNAEGWPVAIEAFAGNTADPATFPSQVRKVKERFGLADIVWVADRGMLTAAQIAKLREVAGTGWISALRSPAIRYLVEAGTIQPSFFDSQNLAEVTDERYPGERLVVCHNPFLALKRTRSREDLLRATERELAKIADRVQRGAAGKRGGLRGEGAIGETLGRVINKYKMAKHFHRSISENSFTYSRDETSISEEAALDGLYVLRTNLAPERLDAPGVVLAYKSLSQVERAFRHFKLSDLEVRPLYHYSEPRVRAHLLLCMLAYWLQRTMQQAWAPLLFVDEAPPERPDPVAPAPRSPEAHRKEKTKLSPDGLPLHSFSTLLADLSTIVRNRALPPGSDTTAAFDLITMPTELQRRAFALLELPLT